LVETGLGLSSAKLYVSKLAMLNDKKGYNNLDFLKKKAEIVNIGFPRQGSENRPFNYAVKYWIRF